MEGGNEFEWECECLHDWVSVSVWRNECEWMSVCMIEWVRVSTWVNEWVPETGIWAVDSVLDLEGCGPRCMFLPWAWPPRSHRQEWRAGVMHAGTGTEAASHTSSCPGNAYRDWCPWTSAPLPGTDQRHEAWGFHNHRVHLQHLIHSMASLLLKYSPALVTPKFLSVVLVRETGFLKNIYIS